MRHRKSRLGRQLRFFLGASNENIEEVKAADPAKIAGIKVFMGSSTGNMLVDEEEVLEKIFRHAPATIATHCEHTPTILQNEEAARKKFGDEVPFSEHPKIRSREACLKSSSLAVELARREEARLHVLHITTAEELSLFEPGHERITAEACVHHLWFEQSGYEALGSLIKCNPAIKSANDRAGDPPSGGRRNHFRSCDRSCPTHLGGKTRKLFSSSRWTSACPAQPSSDARDGERRMLPGRNSGRTGLPCSNPDFRRPRSRIPARRVLGRLGDRRPGEGDGGGRKRTFQPMQLVPVFRNAFLALRRFDDGFRPSGLCERQAGGRTNGQAGGIRQATEIVEGLPFADPCF